MKLAAIAKLIKADGYCKLYKVFYDDCRTYDLYIGTKTAIFPLTGFPKAQNESELATLLGISKKTIYTVFPDKNSLVLEMVDYCFSSIKESEQKVLQDLSLDTVGKIRAILGVLPEGYRELDLRQLYQLKERYPEVYEKVKSRLETGWESTISLLEQGITEGKIRNIQIPILKTMMEATLEQFFQRDVLIQNGISYHEALDEVVSILTDGITI